MEIILELLIFGFIIVSIILFSKINTLSINDIYLESVIKENKKWNDKNNNYVENQIVNTHKEINKLMEYLKIEMITVPEKKFIKRVGKPHS